MASEDMPELSKEAKQVQALEQTIVISPGGEKHLVLGVKWKMVAGSWNWYGVVLGLEDITCAELLTWTRSQ